jgi:hypothetical protein
MNMDQVVAQALATFGRIDASLGPARPAAGSAPVADRQRLQEPARGLAS